MRASPGNLHFVTPGKEEAALYMEIGSRSYCQHYTHLWLNNDPGPYLRRSFTPEVVYQELKEPGLSHYIIYLGAEAVGIIKIIKDSRLYHFPAKEALLLEKLYLLKEVAHRGIGSLALRFVEELAKEANKKLLWLDTMQQGPALGFYLKNGYRIMGNKLLQLPGVLEAKRPMHILGKELA